MKIAALGHSCVLLDMSDATTSTRILVDPWLSDHAVGDAMGRFPRLRFDAADLGPIHGVYLSHAHCDHLDPYTLLRLWRELPEPPALLLPVTLAFLVPVFERFLDDPTIHLLAPHEPLAFRGVELMGFYDLAMEATNEEDVMVLVVSRGDERVLVEADARLSMEVPDLRAYVSELLGAPGLRSVVYLSTENELTGTLDSPLCGSLEERAELAERAMDEMLTAVAHLYALPEPMDDLFDMPPDLWETPHLLRLVHGQGLTAPHELDPRWQRVLFPVTIADRVAAEGDMASAVGCAHRVDALRVGQVHSIEQGQVTELAPIPGLECLDQDEARRYDPDLAFFPDLPSAPLRAGDRDVQQQSHRIHELLNHRFLPYLFAARTPPVLHLLSALGGSYRVRVHFGSTVDGPVQDYRLGFDARGFVPCPAEGEPDEVYWANDLDDFLDGRCDEFTTFGRTPFAVEELRLWACLAAPMLNADLVELRVTHHFERAVAGEGPGSFVLPFYG